VRPGTQQRRLEEIDADDLLDDDDDVISAPRRETPPPPLPTQRDVNSPVEADLSDVFAAITPKKKSTGLSLPPPPPSSKDRQRVGSSKLPPVFIPPPPRVPSIQGPAIPPPIEIPPQMMLPQTRQAMRPRHVYVSSLPALVVDRPPPPAPIAMQTSTMPAPPPAHAPAVAMIAAVAAIFIAVSIGGFAYGFTRGGVVSAAPLKSARSFETSRMGVDTSSVADKEETSSDDAEAKPKSVAIQFGTIRFASPPAGALVDGAPRKVTGGALIVTCGSHRIKWPGHATQVVSVPCNGATTL
jgi:hypothetical protein